MILVSLASFKNLIKRKLTNMLQLPGLFKVILTRGFGNKIENNSGGLRVLDLAIANKRNLSTLCFKV